MESNTYGQWLRERRETAGLTQQELADRAIMTRSYIAHIEAGRRVTSADDARRLDDVLKTGDVLSRFRPVRNSRPVGSHFEAALQFEQQATMIREFAPSYVPGILQTEGYARAVLRTAFPPLSAEQCDQAVVTRLSRAKILTDPVTPVVWALLDEAVLRRPVGGAKVMAEQIDHLVRLVERERIRVHVMPLTLGAHPLLEGMVRLMSFDDQPPVTYTESVQTGQVHDSPALVDRCQRAYALALSDALPLEESLALMRALVRDYEQHG